MATTTTKKTTTRGKKKPTPTQLREENEKLKNGAWCYMCNTHKARDKFYMSTDTLNKSGITPICKECARKIALQTDEDGTEHEPTKASVQKALFYMNKPFLDTVWNSAIQESENLASGKVRSNAFFAYMHIVSMSQYVFKTWQDSDIFKDTATLAKEKDEQIKEDIPENIRDTYEINKKTTLRFLGYDPFENEPASEQPVLYAKLVNYFDESVKDDGLKLEAVIEIVQSFKDVKTINDAISQYKKDLGENPSVISTIKSLADTKQKMIASALALAKDNGISVNYNNSKSKGAGTLSGLIKEMSEMDLDDVEINTFDYETSQAMSQIAENNYVNQMKQLNPDENDWEREVVHQKKLIHTLQTERDKAVEYCRLLRKENKDLKDFLQEKNIIDENLKVKDE